MRVIFLGRRSIQFGEVGVSLFVAGAAFRAILGDRRSVKCCIFPYKMRFQDGSRKVSEAAGARRFCRRIMVGLSSNYPRIVCILAEAIQGLAGEILIAEFRGMRSIW